MLLLQYLIMQNDLIVHTDITEREQLSLKVDRFPVHGVLLVNIHQVVQHPVQTVKRDDFRIRETPETIISIIRLT